MTTQPDLNLGVEAQTSIAGETPVTDFNRTIALDSANIDATGATFSGAVTSANFDSFIEGGDYFP